MLSTYLSQQFEIVTLSMKSIYDRHAIIFLEFNIDDSGSEYEESYILNYAVNLKALQNYTMRLTF